MKKKIDKQGKLNSSVSHILLVENNPDDVRLIQWIISGIRKSQFKLECVDRLKKALKRLAKGGIDVILLDLGLPDSRGIDTLRSVYNKAPKVPIVVLTGLGDEKVSVQAIKEGAQDYLIKGQVDSNLLKRTLMYAIERKQVEEALRESEERFRILVEKSVDAIFLINFNMEFVFWNPAAEKMMGLTTTPTKKFTLSDVLTPDSLKIAVANVAKAALTGTTRGKPYELTVRRIDGTLIDIEVFIGLIKYNGKTHMLGTARDITERKRAEEIQQIFLNFLKISNQHREMLPLLKEFVVGVKSFTGCAAVGIRILDEKGNIPYEAYEGFSQNFYESESALSIKCDKCMCINVTIGTADPKLPFYTEGGSFYMNGTTHFLSSISEEEKGKTRNVCNEFGFESVALVPICSGNHILGLIHVADPQENMVPLEMIETLEKVAMQLGAGLQRVHVEEELMKSEEKYRTLIDNVNIGIYRNTPGPRGKFIEANPASIKMFGYKTRDEFLSIEVADLYQDSDNRKMFEKKILRNGFVKNEELKLKRKDGTLFYGSVSTVAVKDENGEVKYYDGIIEDITERRHAEEQIKKSLKEKEVLLKEIHHRVKNNMQIISSLLNLQSRYIKGKKTLEMFQNSQTRIRAMALVHEKLYRSQDLALINFVEYAQDLVKQLFRSYGISPAIISCNIRIKDVFLDINRAIPCSLIINELVSNSLKHAFPASAKAAAGKPASVKTMAGKPASAKTTAGKFHGRKGKIDIDFYLDKDNKLLLKIKDNGIGLPDNIDFKNIKTLGLQLVTTLVEQLNGTIEVDIKRGTTFKIKFDKSEGK